MTGLLGHVFRLLRDGLLARTLAIGAQPRHSILIGGDMQVLPEKREQ
ncbi:hypothetical protein [Pararhizobium polonicum]|nr:hypothetical protein [Pararhizobium polonicum]